MVGVGVGVREAMIPHPLGRAMLGPPLLEKKRRHLLLILLGPPLALGGDGCHPKGALGCSSSGGERLWGSGTAGRGRCALSGRLLGQLHIVEDPHLQASKRDRGREGGDAWGRHAGRGC